MCTDMHYLLHKRRLDLLRHQVEGGSTGVNKSDKDGRTPLMYCCFENKEEWALGITRMLLQVYMISIFDVVQLTALLLTCLPISRYRFPAN